LLGAVPFLDSAWLMGFLAQGFVAQMDGHMNKFVRSRKKSKEARAKQHAPESFFAGGMEVILFKCSVFGRVVTRGKFRNPRNFLNGRKFVREFSNILYFYMKEVLNMNGQPFNEQHV
jgi:hypothetical protein